MVTSSGDREPAGEAEIQLGVGEEISPARPTGRSTALRVLGIVDFRYLFVANMMMFMAFQMRNVVQSWLALELTDSQAWVGVINGAPAIAIIALGLLGGVASDRWPKRDILLWVRLGLGLVNFVVGYLVMIDVISIWHLLFFRLRRAARSRLECLPVRPSSRTLSAETGCSRRCHSTSRYRLSVG